VYSEDGVRKLLQSVGAFVHFTLRLVPEDLVLQGLCEKSDVIFSCTECGRRMGRFSDRCLMNPNECENYKTSAEKRYLVNDL